MRIWSGGDDSTIDGVTTTAVATNKQFFSLRMLDYFNFFKS